MANRRVESDTLWVNIMLGKGVISVYALGSAWLDPYILPAATIWPATNRADVRSMVTQNERGSNRGIAS